MLDVHERITDVYLYRKHNGDAVVLHGMTFTTTEKTCGPYGEVTSDMLHASGHQLLFMSGKGWDQIKSVMLHFDYGRDSS